MRIHTALTCSARTFIYAANPTSGVTGSAPSAKAWTALLRSWDRQQESSIPNRESKFEAVLTVLGTYLGRRFTVMDLGSGPGSLAVRILERFPQARVTAVDFDPVLLKIGREASKALDRHITWVDADIGSAGWTEQLPSMGFDAVVSSTALHWLDRPRLGRMYGDLARIMRKGGIFLNGDVLPLGEAKKTLTDITEKIRFDRYGTLEVEFGPWERWWKKVEREQKGLGPAFRERKARFAGATAPEGMLSLEDHVQLLHAAGFSEVDTLWQNLMQDRILAAIR